MTEPMPLLQKERELFFKEELKITTARECSETYLASAVSDYDALLVVYAQVSRKIIEAGRNLKVTVRYGIGTDNIDVGAATENRIVVTYCPEYHLPTVAEHTIGLMFALARHVADSDRHVRAGHWDYTEFLGVDIEGKTLGILGLGRIGRVVARKALALGMRVVGYDAYLTAGQIGVDGLVTADFEAVIREADFLVVSVPLTDKTRSMINADVLAKMKPTSFLINTARGPIVDEGALFEALVSGKIAGAALDVMAKEPPDRNHRLYGLDNVVLTPHTSWFTSEAMERLEMTAAKSAMDVLHGRRPQYVRNPEVLAGLKLQ
jgi:D-3-phosphoglycerate dehydrogenase